MSNLHRRIVPALALLALGATLAAQEPETGPPLPPVPPIPGGGPTPDEELLRLFADVERRLVAIDDLLFEAAAAEGEPPAGDAGIDRLLDDTERNSREAVLGIDRILEIARQRQQQQQQQQQGQGGSPPPQGDGQSPIDGAQPPPPQQAEQGPQGNDPSTDPSSPSPEPGQPDSPTESGEDPQEREGGAPPDGGTGPASGASATERWGELPPRVQQLFRNQVSDDMPVQYRDWIDGYHRRLNRRP